MHDDYRWWGAYASPEPGPEHVKYLPMVGEVCIHPAPVGITSPPCPLQVAGHPRDRVEMAFLELVTQQEADGLETEQLECMDPAGQKGESLPAARANLPVEPYLHAAQGLVYEIAFPPPMTMEQVITEDAMEDAQHLGFWVFLAVNHLQLSQFNGNL
nr:hypothetical protein [uncultured Sphaerochaeta sp.]